MFTRKCHRTLSISQLMYTNKKEKKICIFVFLFDHIPTPPRPRSSLLLRPAILQLSTRCPLTSPSLPSAWLLHLSTHLFPHLIGPSVTWPTPPSLTCFQFPSSALQYSTGPFPLIPCQIVCHCVTTVGLWKNPFNVFPSEISADCQIIQQCIHIFALC